MIKKELFKLTQNSFRYGDSEGETILCYSKDKKVLIDYLTILKKEMVSEESDLIVTKDTDTEFYYKGSSGTWSYTMDIELDRLKIIDASDLETPESIENISAWDI